MPLLAVSDVRSVRFAPGRSNMLSIRFKGHDKARTFIGLVQRYPPLDGQHASFSGSADGQRDIEGNTSAALDVLRGTTRASR